MTTEKAKQRKGTMYHKSTRRKGGSILYGLLTLSFLEPSDEAECGLYLAPSSIPGAGMGMYAGMDYDKRDIIGYGDITVPVYDLEWNNHGETYHFLWEEYVWSADSFPEMIDEVSLGYSGVHACSEGFGAAINCMIPLINIREVDHQYRISNEGISTQGPNAGATSPYRGRLFSARRKIAAGTELFLGYGEDYFLQRVDTYGYIPFKESYKHADRLISSFLKMKKNLRNTPKSFAQDIYNFVQSTIPQTWNGTSRVLNALPEEYRKVQTILHTGGTAKQHFLRSVHTTQWLEQNGQCMDNIRDGRSTLPGGAGQGAFATRYIPEGGLVSPAPLIHLPNRSSLIVYDGKLNEDGKWRPDRSSPRHEQLLVNYCFGHPESTLLLCPYGLLNMLINHSKEKTNAKIMWSQQMRHPEWLNQSISSFGNTKHAGLSMDIVATRDIGPGEEIFIDYGDDWEEAWQRHVRNWRIPRPSYVPSFELNQNVDLILQTMYEKSYEDDGVFLTCRDFYLHEQLGTTVVLSNKKSKKEDEDDFLTFDCRILSRSDSNEYVVEVVERREDNRRCWVKRKGRILFDLPRDAFVFRDIPYERDHHQPWSFRHSIGIPDDMFPETWKNVKPV